MRKLLLGILALGSLSAQAASVGLSSGNYAITIENDSKFLLEIKAVSALVSCSGETRRIFDQDTYSVTVHDSAKLESQTLRIRPFENELLTFDLSRALKKSTKELSVFLKDKSCNFNFSLSYQIVDASSEKVIIKNQTLIINSLEVRNDLSFSPVNMPTELRYEITNDDCGSLFTLPETKNLTLTDSLLNNPEYQWRRQSPLCD